MKIGCNYSDELMALLADGHVKVDYIKLGLFKLYHAWVLGETKPEVITLEYGGPAPNYAGKSDIAALERQLTRLYQIASRGKCGSTC